jgi:thioredoxin 1
MSIRAVKFSATWCGPCTVVSKQLEGLDIEQIDIDEDIDGLAKEANVRAVPTIVFYKDDKEVARHAGLITRKEYLSMLESL